MMVDPNDLSISFLNFVAYSLGTGSRDLLGNALIFRKLGNFRGIPFFIPCSLGTSSTIFTGNSRVFPHSLGIPVISLGISLIFDLVE